MNKHKLTFTSPKLPVSVNKLYFTKFGRRVLSSEGRAWKNSFITSKGGLKATDFMYFDFNPAKKYNLSLCFYIYKDRLVSKSFGSNKNTKYKYKKLDVSNLVKLIEDCISVITGIPDQNNYQVSVVKEEISREDSKGERVVAYYEQRGSQDG